MTINTGMGRPGSRVDFNSLDYPDGLTVYIDYAAVHSTTPTRPNIAPIDGTGWAEAAFESREAEMLRRGYVLVNGMWCKTARQRAAFAVPDREIADLYRWAREEGGPPEPKGFGPAPLCKPGDWSGL